MLWNLHRIAVMTKLILLSVYATIALLIFLNWYTLCVKEIDSIVTVTPYH